MAGLKCERCSKRVNKADLKGVPWNDWPLTKPKIKWFCPQCFANYKSRESSNERKSLEERWWILEDMIDQRSEGWEINVDSIKEHHEGLEKFIDKHSKMKLADLRVAQNTIQKKKSKGTNAYEQTRIVRPGDPFFIL